MKIWQLCFDVNNYAALQAEPPLTADELQSFNGSTKLLNWKPYKVSPIEKDMPLGNSPVFSFPVFSETACNILKPLIKHEVELLPLLCDEGAFYGVNVTNVLNVIDYAKSKYYTYRDGKRIMSFQKYSFRLCDELKTSNIFKIVDEPTRRAFVSERVKRAIEENSLEGFDLRLVWEE